MNEIIMVALNILTISLWVAGLFAPIQLQSLLWAFPAGVGVGYALFEILRKTGVI